MTAGMAGDILLGFLGGLTLGALHLLWLWRASVQLGEGAGAKRLLAGAATRLAAVLAGFAAVAWMAMQPGLALLAALIGFALARTLGLRRARKRSS